MKKTKILLKMAALAVVGAMMSGCAEEVEVLQPANQRVVQKTTISLADDATTRGAIAADGKTSFSENDQIAVIYQDTNGKTMKAVSAALTDADLTDGGASATFTVELVSPKAGTKVRYIYPASMAAATIAEDTAPDNDLTISTAGLAKQVGTLEAIAKNLGLAVYDGTMSTTATLPTDTGVELKNQLAILKLQSIKDDGGTEIRSQITDLTVDDGTNTYAVTRTAADAPIYVAMLPVATAEDITISTTFGGFPYTKTATGKTLAKNKIYPVNLAMDFDAKSTPLTLEVTVDNTTIDCINNSRVPFRYTVNGVETSVDGSSPETLISSLQTGDIVQFFSTNTSLSDGSGRGLNIRPNKKCYVYGNVMSLIDDGTEGFANDKTIGGVLSLSDLFKNANIAFHPSKRLVLPATTLASDCYDQMFAECDGITSLPEDFLPATTLAWACYGGMFYDCDGLTSLPESLLPAGKDGEGMLAEWCYSEMFAGCNGLTTLPEKLLPAMTLKDDCYSGMFFKCDGLTTLPEKLLPAGKDGEGMLAEWCYSGMFAGCTSLTTAPDLPATTLAKNCYCKMFESCESLTTAPELRATTLTPGCYSGMFNSCTKLSSITCLATDISADCLYGWLSEAGIEDGCGRVVYVDPSMLATGTDNVPGEWNLDNSGEDFKLWTLAEVGRYPIALSSAKSIDLGRLVGADGKIYASASQISTAGTTAIGVIAYVDDATTTADDEITEKSHGGGHGLVLCLKNAASNVKWSTEQVSKFTGQTVTNADGLRRTTNVSGYTNTATLTVDAETAAKYPAAAAAKNYTGLTAPTGTTGWFLPSAQQWVKMQTALGGLSIDDIKWGNFDNSLSGATAWETALTKAGAGNYDSIMNRSYWSSSEYSDCYGVELYVVSNDALNNYYSFCWNYANKTYSSNSSKYNCVRPALAF